jgi:hypothetical protein
MALQSIERGLTRGIAPLRRYERRAHGDLYVHEHFFEMRYQQKPQELSPYCRGDEKRAVIGTNVMLAPMPPRQIAVCLYEGATRLVQLSTALCHSPGGASFDWSIATDGDLIFSGLRLLRPLSPDRRTRVSGWTSWSE